MSSRPEILRFDCEGDSLLGMLHRPATPAQRAVLIVTGGPQYRVGSHRQFLLLGRTLADHGIAAMRFDYRGMGDSEGQSRPYDQLHADVQAAVTACYAALPHLAELILWGLCDGATAAALYAASDARIHGVILLNPWVHSAALQQQVLLRQYYPQRLLSAHFWRHLPSQAAALISRLAQLIRASASSITVQRAPAVHTADTARPEQMLYQALSAFGGRVLIILAGADLGARQLLHLCATQRRWRQLLSRSGTRLHTIAGANHTFASQYWRAQVSQRCIDWIQP